MSVDKLGRSSGYLKQEQGCRDKALKMYPWVCGRCAREFAYSQLRELTVHHRDHNHDVTIQHIFHFPTSFPRRRGSRWQPSLKLLPSSLK